MASVECFCCPTIPNDWQRWYRDNLGISCHESPDYNSIYNVFESRDLTDASLKRSTAWAILRSDSDIDGMPRTGRIARISTWRAARERKAENRLVRNGDKALNIGLRKSLLDS
jgi:hypothetical protein